MDLALSRRLKRPPFLWLLSSSKQLAGLSPVPKDARSSCPLRRRPGLFSPAAHRPGRGGCPVILSSPGPRARSPYRPKREATQIWTSWQSAWSPGCPAPEGQGHSWFRDWARVGSQVETQPRGRHAPPPSDFCLCVPKAQAQGHLCSLMCSGAPRTGLAPRRGSHSTHGMCRWINSRRSPVSCLKTIPTGGGRQWLP